MKGAAPKSRGGTAILWVLAFMLALYASVHFVSPLPAFFSPEEGASWTLAASLAAHHWLQATLAVPAASIDPRGGFADPYTQARGDGWHSRVPPLAPMLASFPLALLGAAGAWTVPALAAVACVLLSIRIGRRLVPADPGGCRVADDPRSPIPFAVAVSATPLIVHGALFCGHTLAAALVLAALDLFMAAVERRTLRRGGPLAILVTGALCAALASLAQFEAGWIFIAVPAAWLFLRFGGPRMNGTEGPRWAIPFLGLASALHVAAAGVFTILYPQRAHAPQWGSPLLLPVMIPATLALVGLLRTLSLRDESMPSGAVPSRGWPRTLLRLLLAAGAITQSAGFRTVLMGREANVAVVSALAGSARPGEGVVCEAAGLPGLAATLAMSRSIFHLGPEADIDPLLRSFEEHGVVAFTAVSPAGEGEADPLARRRSAGRFVREEEPRQAGEFLMARFASGGPAPSRPSLPPRGD